MRTVKLFLIAMLLSHQSLSQTINAKFDKFEFNQGGFIFRIDPRNEFLYSMFIINGYPNAVAENFQYKRDILANFSRYRLLEEVKEFANHFRTKWNDLADPAWFTIQFDDNFNLLPNADKAFVDKLGGRAVMTDLGKLLQRIIKKINYIQFFNSQKAFFNVILNNASYNFRNFNERQRFENFYQVKSNSYIVVFNFLELNGNFGPHLDSPNGNTMYAFITPEGFAGEVPVFKMTYSFLSMVYHEFSHSFTNPIVFKYQEELKKYDYLFDPIKESMNGQAYPDWITCLCEHMVRAVTVYFAEQKFGREISDLIYRRREIGHKFIYTDKIVTLIKEYETNKKMYKSFESFFPKIVKMFSNISKDEISPLLQTVIEARLPEAERILKPAEVPIDSNTVIVVSTHEPSEGNQKVKEFAMAYDGSGSVPGIKVITDDEALSADLANANLFIYGTPEGNSFLKKYISNLPVIIGKKYIVAGEKTEGDNLQFIFSWTNPFNSNKAMVIISAQHAEDMFNYAWSAIRESNNFWIAQNLVTLKTGNFVRLDKIWFAQ